MKKAKPLVGASARSVLPLVLLTWLNDGKDIQPLNTCGIYPPNFFTNLCEERKLKCNWLMENGW